MTGAAPFPHALPAQEAACSLCGHAGPFEPVRPGASLRETRCPGCGSSRRNRDMATVLLHYYAPDSAGPLCGNLDRFADLRIFELQARGALHTVLRNLPGYRCSEYFPDVARGERNKDGVQCQDATALTFEDASFDLVISQDVMEHISPVWHALREIQRVLVPGGRHIFTVPVQERVPTRKRGEQDPGGEPKFLVPPVYHKDPLNREGALVFWDFGLDLPECASAKGIPTVHASSSRFYTAHETCFVATPEQYADYLMHRQAGSHVLFFLYNSHVFVTEKGR